jgi:hypothetical protein
MSKMDLGENSRRLTILRSFTSTSTVFMFGYSDNFRVYCKNISWFNLNIQLAVTLSKWNTTQSVLHESLISYVLCHVFTLHK